VFERLRAALGTSGAAHDLVESVRRALTCESERGYHEGWASTKRPRRRHPEEDIGSRRRRR
jgi:hypothetical protein